MKIVIGCQEVCGWISFLAAEFERSGHEVITISNKSKYTREIEYTLDKDKFEESYFRLRFKSNVLASLFFFFYKGLRLSGKLLFRKDLNNRVRVHANNYLYKTADLYIHIWEGLETNDTDLQKFKNNKARIVSYFVGDEIRYYPTALKEFKIDHAYFLEYSKKEIYSQMRKLRMHEKYADAVFSVPDQSSLALRPYFHLQVPIDLAKYTFKKTGNTRPVILHIPSAPLLKGSPVFFKAIEELKAEGLDFEFKAVTGIPNKEVLALLTNADILLDELYMHGPGMLGFEAMASGCSVVVKYLENSPGSFRPPVVNVNEYTVKEKLRELIVNRQLREELIDKGLAFVQNTNAVSKVCSMILEKLDATDYDYYPSYFRNEFEPDENQDLEKINDLTEIVKNENWYKKYVQPGERNGLKF